MIKDVQPITSADFNKGLVTRSDILKGDINASPNTMDVQWNFDSSLHKRLGCSSSNTIPLTTTTTANASWTLDSTSSLSVSLMAYWNLDEASGTRFDSIGTNNLTDQNGVTQVVGIRNQAAQFVTANSQGLYIENNSSLATGNINFSLSHWVYFDPASMNTAIVVMAKRNANDNFEWQLQKSGANNLIFQVSSDGNNFTNLTASSFGAVTTSTWYNVITWHSNNSHIGISVNLSVNTAAYTGGVLAGSGKLLFAMADTGSTQNENWDSARGDETGFWKKVLSLTERQNLYGGGSGNTYSVTGANSPYAWASFDFGASSIRWLTVAAGTGLYASSNRGTTFIAIGTSRTQTYQALNRSNNVLIATSDAYDVPLYWAGSAGTFAATVAPGSAPGCRFSINYNGFLILLNSSTRKRGFFYANQNTQLTDPWNNSFDLPSSADDEITGAFVLYKFLYVSTRYKIYRLSYVGGNPDWSYLEVKQWGYTPRTVDILTLEQAGQVAIGLDWNSRLRMFDGFYDRFISNNIENNNGLCDFATSKISYAGSGLQLCHGLLNPVTQEYRLNVAIGSQSTQTTHAIILNARNNALYPYSNQNWQTMCIAESNNQRALMAFDRSGFCYILDSGNLDSTTAIAEVYDTPPLFTQSPEIVSKGHQLNLFFGVASCGTIYQQSRIDLSNQWGTQNPLSNAKGNTVLTGTENAIKILRTIDVKETYNTIQFRLTSSGNTLNTANPWELDRLDFLQQGFGIGKGGG